MTHSGHLGNPMLWTVSTVSTIMDRTAQRCGMDIGGWLRGLGLEQYEPAFRDNAIDAETLATLTADDLRELGVAAIGHRKKLLAAIAALGAAALAPIAGTETIAVPTQARPVLATPSGGERRHLTVMFCDLVGSTAIVGRRRRCDGLFRLSASAG